MPLSPQALQREATRRLPELLGDLLDEPDVLLRPELLDPNGGVDIVARDHRDRQWLFELKSSSGPGQVARAAAHLRIAGLPDAITVLVVPYMTSAGAAAAAEQGVNWLDLSGNACIRDENLYISREGRPNAFRVRGRPASAFAPKSARVARALLADPLRWWRQKDLAAATRLDDGRISRVVGRLQEQQLLERRGDELRPLDPNLFLDAWAEDYRFDRHDAVLGHTSGSGIELARDLSERLSDRDVQHAFTGLPAAWVLDPFARFRLVSAYVEGDPREAADHLELRRNERGANVQLLAADDDAVIDDRYQRDGLPVVSPVQVYLDLRHLPERAPEAAEHLRKSGLVWAR